MRLAPPFLRRSGWLALGLLAVFVLAEIAARVVLTQTPDAIRWYDESAQLKVGQMDARGDVDVVFAGTSMAWQAFVPSVYDEMTGASSYNAGLNGGTPEVMQRWLLEEVVPRTHPDTVVWGLSSLDIAPNYGDEQRAIYDQALATRTGTLADIEQAAARYSALIANRTVLRSMSDTVGYGADSRRATFDDAADALGADGERLDFRTDRSDRLRGLTEARLLAFEPDAGDIATISATVRALQDQGIRVVLVELPVPQRFIDAHPRGNVDHGRVAPTLAALARTLDVPLLLLTTGFADGDFVDFTHLSQDGANSLSRTLADAITSGRDDRATYVAPPPFTGAAPSSDLTGCVTELVIDEYGFEVETLVCPDETEGPAPAPTPAGEDAGAHLVEELASLFVARPCADEIASPVLPPDLEPATAAALAEALRLLASAADLCGTTAYTPAWSDAISALERAAGIERVPADPTSPTETASRALSAIGSLRVELADQPPTTSSWEWLHSDELMATLELRRRAQNGDPAEVVAIGNSIPLNALDQPQLDAQFDGRFLNVASAGAEAEEWQVVYPRMFADVPPPSTVLWGLTSHRLLDPRGTDCARRSERVVRRTSTYRSSLFPDLRNAWSAADLLLGPDVANTPAASTPAYRVGENRFRAPGDKKYETGTFEGIPDTESRYPNPVFCRDRLDIIEDVVRTIRASGAEVTFVLLPLHREVIAAAPARHAEVTRALLDLADALDVAVIDVSTSYEDSETPDGWHANRAGRSRVTADLIDALQSEN